MSDASLPWLTPAEVEELTALRRWSAQCRALSRMGIAFLPNAVRRPLVERAAILRKDPGPTTSRKTEPNWSALERRAKNLPRKRLRSL